MLIKIDFSLAARGFGFIYFKRVIARHYPLYHHCSLCFSASTQNLITFHSNVSVLQHNCICYINSLDLALCYNNCCLKHTLTGKLGLENVMNPDNICQNIQMEDTYVESIRIGKMCIYDMGEGIIWEYTNQLMCILPVLASSSGKRSSIH